MSTQADLLLDVSRLIWRLSRNRLPTGIDRVCLEYVAHYRHRSQAVVQWGNIKVILPRSVSNDLFDIILSNCRAFILRISLLGVRSLPKLLNSSRGDSRIYLNVGHSGLDRPGLSEWITETGVRPIFMIHDLIPITHPEYCRPGGAAKHESRINLILRTGLGIIGNSQTTLNALSDHAKASGLPLPHAVAAWLGTTPLSSTVATNPEINHPYFVALGTIEGRKNHLILLQTWRSLIQKHGHAAPHLVIIGQRGWEASEAFSLLDNDDILRTHVVELRRCSDAELAHYLGNARALLFPSFAEGYGMPLVEALSLGTPVIASDLEVFRELAGDIPKFLDPSDLSAWQAAVEEYCLPTSNARRAQLLRIREYEAPTWPMHFAKVDRWIQNL